MYRFILVLIHVFDKSVFYNQPSKDFCLTFIRSRLSLEIEQKLLPNIGNLMHLAAASIRALFVVNVSNDHHSLIDCK